MTLEEGTNRAGVARQRRPIAAALALALSISAAPAPAQPADERDRAAARELGYAGIADFQAGRLDDALDKLDRAWLAVRVPAVGLWSARAMVRLGRLVQASERLHQVARSEIPDVPGIEREVQQAAQNDAMRERAELAPRIPGLEVVLLGADAAEARLMLDGAPIATALVGTRLLVDPGNHVVSGDVRGRQVHEEASLAEGETRRIELVAPPLAPARAAASPPAGSPVERGPTAVVARGLGPWRTAAIVAGSAGVAAIGVGGVFAIVAGSTWRDANAACPNKSACPDERGHTLSLEARDQARVATISLGIGASVVGAAVVLWLVAPRSAPLAAYDRRGAGFAF